jgi:coenzyme F420-reducing hydrogenase delta subunit
LSLSTEKLPKNIKQVEMLSLGKLSPKLILEMFEKGADGVLITPCDDSCHFGDLCNTWTEKRVETARDLLSSIGIEKERIRHHKLSSNNKNEFLQTANQMVKDVRKLN